MKRPIFISTGDWHLTDKQPVCSLAKDWIETQFNAVEQIINLAIKKDIPILHCGDLFDKATDASTNLMFRFIEARGDVSINIVPGNHDLINHNTIKGTAFSVVCKDAANKYPDMEYLVPYYHDRKINHVHMLPYLPDDQFNKLRDQRLLCIHKLVYKSTPFPGAPESGNAENICKQFPNTKLILCSDNHESFVYQSTTGQTLVNNGMIVRDSAALMDYKTKAWIIYDDLTVEPFYLDMSLDIITDEHIVRDKERTKANELFFRAVTDARDFTLSFYDNLTKVANGTSCEEYILNTYKEIC